MLTDFDASLCRRCFNCGTPAHVVNGCPEPLNHKLISLSRAMHNFYFAPGPAGRFHETEEWRLTRLRWLDEFKPGEVRGSELREALGLQEGDSGTNVPWLHNILVWGYPKGWTGPDNPRLSVEARILCHVEHALGELKVYGDEDGVEVVDLDSFDAYSVLSETTTLDDSTSSPEPEFAPDAVEERSQMSPAKIKYGPETSTRWANYMTDLFLSDRLPIYNRRPLENDRESNPEGSEPYTSPRAVNEIEIIKSCLPWRHPDAFSTNSNRGQIYLGH